MASSETQSKIINLGEALVKELAHGEHSTTLSRWVSHYIAEQIEFLKTARGKEKKIAQKRCFEAILQLWKQRHSLPSGLHPFGGFEPILRVLAEIEPEKRSAFYAGARLDPKKARDKKAPDAEAMMEFVAGTDRAARILIELGLELAVGYAESPRTKTYLKSVYSKEKRNDVMTVERLMERMNRLTDTDPRKDSKEMAELWEKRIDSLDRFSKIAAKVRADLDGRLQKLKAQSVKSP